MSNIIQSVLPLLVDGYEYRVTSPFGYRVDPVTGRPNNAHKGIDLVVWRDGWSDVSNIGAAWDGVVTAVFDGVSGYSAEQSAGNYVVIDHGNGWTTRYFHLFQNTICVSVGERVCAGQVIGYMGSTGKSTGAHLHFQLEKNGVPIDPEPYITGCEAIDFSMDECIAELDNTPAEWAEEAIAWAHGNGILNGDENGNFHLREPITCERMLVFLYRAITGGGR